MTEPIVYEYVAHGQVVERVQPSPHAVDIEATRLGVAVLDAKAAAARGELGDEYWRVAGEEIANATPTESTEVDATPAEDSKPAKLAPNKEK